MSNSDNALIVCLPRQLGDAVMAMPAMRMLSEAGCDIRLLGRTEHVAKIISMLTGFEEALGDWTTDRLYVPWPNNAKCCAELERFFPAARMFYCDDECESQYGAFSSNAADAPIIEHPRSQIELNVQVACRILNQPCNEEVIANATRLPVVTQPVTDLGAQLPQGIPDSYVVFSPGTSAPLRRWPLQHFACLSDLIRDQLGIPVVFLGHPTERHLVERINALANAPLLDGLDFDLEEQLRVLAQSAAVVANDNGSAHLASILNTPTVVIFGPTSENLTGALGCIRLRTKDAVFQKSCCPFPCGAKKLCQYNRRHGPPILSGLYPLLHRVRNLLGNDPAETNRSPTFREQYFAACAASLTPESVLEVVNRHMREPSALHQC